MKNDERNDVKQRKTRRMGIQKLFFTQHAKQNQLLLGNENVKKMWLKYKLLKLKIKMTTPDHVRQNVKMLRPAIFSFFGEIGQIAVATISFSLISIDSFVRDFQIKNLGSTRPPKGRKSRACRRAALSLFLFSYGQFK